MCANCRVEQKCQYVRESAFRRGEKFFFCLYSPWVCACVNQCALVVAAILKCSTFLAVVSEYSTVSVIFPLTPLLCFLYWPWDSLSS